MPRLLPRQSSLAAQGLDRCQLFDLIDDAQLEIRAFWHEPPGCNRGYPGETASANRCATLVACGQGSFLWFCWAWSRRVAGRAPSPTRAHGCFSTLVTTWRAPRTQTVAWSSTSVETRVTSSPRLTSRRRPISLPRRTTAVAPRASRRRWTCAAGRRAIVWQSGSTVCRIRWLRLTIAERWQPRTAIVPSRHRPSARSRLRARPRPSLAAGIRSTNKPAKNARLHFTLVLALCPGCC